MVRVLHLTDTHLTAEPPPVRSGVLPASVLAATGRSTNDWARHVIDHVLDGGPVDLVLHTGDVVDDPDPDAYAAAADLLAATGAPLLVTPGNHDDPTMLEAAFGDAAPSGCGSIDVGAWRVAVANSAAPGVHGGRYHPDVLDLLDRELATDRLVLLGVHHPPVSPCPAPECTTTNADELLAIVARHRTTVAVATGHLHHAGEATHDGVHHLGGPSTCLQLVHRHPLGDHNAPPTPVGARLVDLHDDGSLTTSVVWLPG